MIPTCLHSSRPNGCEPVLQTVSCHVKKFVYQARLEDVSAHTLRHSFAKNLVDTGTLLDQVATPLGHESLDTARIYTQPGERDLDWAVQRTAGDIVDERY